MRLGVDWVVLAVLVAAWAFAQVRAVPAWVRYGVFALACFGVAGYRLLQGAAGSNLIVVVVAVVLGVAYLVRSVRSLRPPSD